jgi:hypothetical protein
MTGRRGGLTFFQRHNPVVRHTVVRRRSTLEEKGLLPRIAVDIHPLRRDEHDFFVGLALRTDAPIERAYAAAERYTTF